MSYFVNKILIIFLLLTQVCGIKFNSIYPNYVYTGFSSKIETHLLQANITESEKKGLMMYIGLLDADFDRQLPNSSRVYCHNQNNKIIKDLSRQEGYLYSCCSFKNKDTYNNSIYQCPIPPPEILPDPFETFFSYQTPIYVRSILGEQDWELTDITFEYRENLDLGGVLKKILTLLVISTIVISITSGILGAINTFSNKYPKSFICMHFFILILMFTIEYELINNINSAGIDSYSGIKNGLIYSMFSIIYSVFIIYIPHIKDVNNLRLKDQRIVIHKSNILYRCISLLKHKYTKDVLTFIFLGLIIMQYKAIYSIIYASRQYFDSDWEIMLGIVISYSLLSILFIVSFLTGIYEIHIPIKFNKNTGEMTQIIPKSHNIKDKKIQMLSRKVTNQQVSNNNFIIGYCYNGEIIQLNYDNLEEGNIVIIDSDIDNINNPYQYLVWKIGSTVNGKIIYDKNILSYRVTKYEKKQEFIKLDYRNNYYKLNAYEVVNISSENNYSYINIGYIKKGILHENHRYFLKLIAFMFKLIPDYNDEYEYNAIENIRQEWHRITNSCGKVYGYIYQCIFIIVTILLITFEIYVRPDPLEILLIIIMILYTINVNTKKKNTNPLRREKAYTNFFKELKTNTRAGENIQEYNLDTKYLDKLSYQPSNYINSEYKYDLNWIIIKGKPYYNRYFKVNIPKYCDIAGFGLSTHSSNNLLDMLIPSIWLENKNSIQNIIVKTDAGSKTEILHNINNEYITLGLGFILNKIIIVTPNGNTYISNKISGNIALCLPKHIEYVIEDTVIPIIETEGLITFPPCRLIYNNELQFSINTIDNKITYHKNTNWNNKCEIGLNNDNNISYAELNSKNIPSKLKIININTRHKGLAVCFSNLDFRVGNKPNDLNVTINFNYTTELPKFISLGFVEKRFATYQGFMDTIPGWKNSNSIGFHSDDGSFNIGNTIEHRNFPSEKTIWQLQNTKVIANIGFDGNNLYCQTNNLRISVTKQDILPQSWINGEEYIPVLYLYGPISGELDFIFKSIY